MGHLEIAYALLLIMIAEGAALSIVIFGRSTNVIKYFFVALSYKLL